MPIYEYTCEKCENCFEKLVFAGDDDPVECPECGTKKVTKLMSCTNAIGEGIGGACTSGAAGGFS
jgi:putative FmdB family regulatory protein